MTAPSSTDIDWPLSHRIIRTIYPPVWLFEDIADPADWELIASAEAKTNPRVRDQIGELKLVPDHRRVAGPSASLAMSAFTHVSRDRPSRFSDGRFGVWYCGDRFEVALMETVYHVERFMRRTAEPTADIQLRELTAHVAGRLHDLRAAAGDFAACLDPDDWSAGQALALRLHRQGSDGIVYPSVRWPAGQAAALFWPDLIRLPIVQSRTLQYHWDGHSITRYFIIGRDDWYALPSD
ncbi:RES family NAD+ phosphorylase [Dongia soli]|uniref:RES family NAD+ phosphorylase n=1 Tax=Dongia soli TaxID=600628 RepID=A0ABU5EF77_9PROT|nr:RES family NAD+ phosphorylase [Dongia soli]MDY0884876.1 RES family NAD+ phosphorylase [Dongia soli]